MSKEKTKQFNIRIAESLYDEIKKEADDQEITMTEYVISKLTADSSDIDSSYINQLKSELDRQIEAIQNKDNLIQELTRLVDQQQQLTLQSNKQVELLQLEMETGEKNSLEEREAKKGFFSRWFSS